MSVNRDAIVFVGILLALAGPSGCSKPEPPVEHYDSVAVSPVSGQIPVPPGFSKSRDFEDRFSDDLARQIVRGSDKTLKVVPPDVVKDKQQPGQSVGELGKALDVQTVLVAKINPNNGRITFQLIVAETGKLLWLEDFPYGENGVSLPTIGGEAATKVVKALKGVPRK